MVKRIRGVTFSTRVSVQFENTMIHAARGHVNSLLPDVHIFTDHKAGPLAGKSPGYGISLVAETTSGCCISADNAVCYARVEEDGEIDGEEKKDLIPPEAAGEQIACVLLEEMKQGGVVDSTHQGLPFLLCALCSQDVSKVRVGKLSPYGIQALRHIETFWAYTALLSKVLWNIHRKKNFLWVRWIHHTYLQRSGIWEVSTNRKHSALFRRLLSIKDIMIGREGSAELAR